ncbi:MAG: ABC transporter ATP-binding protein [Rhodospirillales bacterium]|nr:ABC transporter ATP-binding protein [Rhodospirillales bacterium]
MGSIVKNGIAPAIVASALVQLTDLTLGYNRHPAVHHLGGAFLEGSLTAVVGPNGAGKSTLLKGIVGMLKPLDGEISIPGLARNDIAYLPQQADVDRSFPITVIDVLCLGLWGEIGLFQAVGRSRLARVEAALSAVGLDRFEQRPIGSLSGGQFQRVLFARLLLQDARLILLDEPFTAIDMRTTADLLQLILRWHGERRTIVAALHDFDLVREHFPEALLLSREPIAWGRTAEVLTPANLLRARQLCESWDEAADLCRRAD